MTDTCGELSDAALDVSWAEFRSRLADRLAELGEGDELLVEALTGDAGASDAAYVRLCRRGHELVTEAIGGRRDRVPLAQVDRAAVEACRVLRDDHGVPHPAFLLAVGLQDDLASLPPREHEVGLRAQVDATLAQMFDDLEPDDDGDLPCRVGLSVVFVRVLEGRAGVELFAELVADATRPDLLARELDLLNRSHPVASFSLVGTTVHMSQHVSAAPYSAGRLRSALALMLGEVDDLAEWLAARVGGRRFLEEPAPEHEPAYDRGRACPGLAAPRPLLRRRR